MLSRVAAMILEELGSMGHLQDMQSLRVEGKKCLHNIQIKIFMGKYLK